MVISMNYIVTIIAITFVICVVILGSNFFFIRRYTNARRHLHQAALQKLLSEKTSYEKYSAISKRTSVRNSPIRKSGDFLDFFLSFAEENSENAIERKLASMDCGEIYGQ